MEKEVEGCVGMKKVGNIYNSGNCISLQAEFPALQEERRSVLTNGPHVARGAPSPHCSCQGVCFAFVEFHIGGEGEGRKGMGREGGKGKSERSRECGSMLS